MKPITSVHNPRFKSALQLARHRGRSRQDRYAIQGVRAIERALGAAVEIEECFCCPALCDASESQLVARMDAGGIPVWSLPGELFERLRYGQTTESVIMIARPTVRSLLELELSARPLVVVVEQVEKPGNLGAILRTADAVAADAVILADPSVDRFHPNVIRASTGAVFSLPIATATASEARQWLESRGLQICAATPDAQRTYTVIDLTRPTALVFGNEAGGLSSIWRDDSVLQFRLPMRGVADSLNVSVTAAVVLFEAQRQRSSQV